MVSNDQIAIAVGSWAGHSNIDKFGRNADVDSGAAEDVWDGGGTWAAPASDEIHNLTSTSNADTTTTPNGSGALTVQVYGLSGGVLTNETVSLTGTAQAPTVNAYGIIHRMIVRSAGSGEANAGTISATAAVSETVTAQIAAGNNQSLMAIYQIPTGKQGVMVSWYGSINRNVTNGSADLQLLVKESGQVFAVKSWRGLVSAGSSAFRHSFEVPPVFPALATVKVRAAVTADNTDVSAGFDMILQDV